MFRTFARRFSTSRLYNHICETIGNTPIVRINRLGPNNINIYAKCEFFNPLSSVKDRMAVGLIDDAEKRGVLGQNSPNNNFTVVEATSGNAGIALAMVCAQRGYQFVAVMAENFSVERRKIMRALGAKVVITPAKDKGYGMVLKSKELADKHGWFLASQFVVCYIPVLIIHNIAFFFSLFFFFFFLCFYLVGNISLSLLPCHRQNIN